MMASRLWSRDGRPADREKVEELLEAAKTGNLHWVQRLIGDSGLPVDSRHPADGPTPLYWAACNGFVSVCSWLIGRLADPNFALPRSGSTPLHAAADRGHYDCVLLLICSGAIVNQKTTNNGDTSLHLAAYRGFSSVCSLLIDHGADVFALNKQNRTPLDEAYITGKVDIARMICRKHSELLGAKKPPSKKSGVRRELFASARSSSLDLHKSEYASAMHPIRHPHLHHHHLHHPHPHLPSYPGIDIDDRIGIQQFDNTRKCSSAPVGDDVTSAGRLKVPDDSEATGGTPENKEISKILFSFHTDLMEQVERLNSAAKEKDRELLQLRRENGRLREELRKFTDAHRPR